MSAREAASISTTGGWRRVWANRPAVIGTLFLLIAIVGNGLLAPTALRHINVQSLDTAIRHAPALAPVIPIEDFDLQRGATDGSLDRLVTGWVHRVSSWMGHDDLGRSVSIRVSFGFLVSLGIGLAAAAVAVLLGGLWGAISGLSGGWVDWFMMRVVDVLFGLPYVLMVILLRVAISPIIVSLLGQRSAIANIVTLLLAIGGVSWLNMARVVRGQVLSLRDLGFVEASRAVGAGNLHILRNHVFPHLIGPIIVYATLVVPQAILQEAFLGFLGLGVQPPIPSLGRLAADGVQAVNTFVGFWWLIVFPCGVLVTTLLALNFVGDGLRDALDPKSTTGPMV